MGRSRDYVADLFGVPPTNRQELAQVMDDRRGHLFRQIAYDVAEQVAERYFSGYQSAQRAYAEGLGRVQRDIDVAIATKDFNGGRPLKLHVDVECEIEIWDRGEVNVEIKWANSDIGYLATCTWSA